MGSLLRTVIASQVNDILTAVTLACVYVCVWAGSNTGMDSLCERMWVTLVTVAKGVAALRAGAAAWCCPPGSLRRSGSRRHIGSDSQRRRGVPAARPAHSAKSSASQRCPETHWTGLAPPRPLNRGRLCPFYPPWSVESSPGGGGGPVRAAVRHHGPVSAAGTGFWRTWPPWRN